MARRRTPRQRAASRRNGAKNHGKHTLYGSALKIALGASQKALPGISVANALYEQKVGNQPKRKLIKYGRR